MNNNLHPDLEKILLDEKQIENIIDNLANKINEDYKGEELTVVIILTGSIFFACDLLKKITLPVTIEFMKVSSYLSGAVSTGVINVKKDLERDINGKNVLLIEDIVDSGNTLYHVYNLLTKRNPKSLKICTLLDKPERRESKVEVTYSGTIIPNEFVVGYGLDYDEKYRNIPYIGVLKREIYE